MNELFDIEQNEVFTPKKGSRWSAERVERLKAIRAEKKRQFKLVRDADIFGDSISAKLAEITAKIAPSEKVEKHILNFKNCGKKEFMLMCELCGTTKKCRNRCSLKWCPRCTSAVANQRRELMLKLTAGCFRVLHVVLTQRNFYTNLAEEISKARGRIAKLYRRKVFGKVRGGCIAIEITNEKKGWHLHFHMLLDASWVDAKELSKVWGKLVGQDYAIVKVLDVTEKSYVQEVCKYVVSAQELAKWTPEKILTFIEALASRQMFSTFGSFRGMKKFAKLMLESEKLEEQPCACGCGQWVVGNDREHCKRIIESRNR
jgi:hypothetical protein